VQRFEEPAVLVGHLGVAGGAARQTDGRIQFQHDVKSGGAHSGNCFRNPVGIGNRIINGVSQFSQQLFHAVIELQRHTSRRREVGAHPA
jgi:hypothetical protein